ncbi:hypothetical protein [Niveispirillum irakense]|uniref:hypothetical protein n=1 Tax=Niveispirillum irakense TaxID=34011 RepID=UPI0003F812D0|nr:hypothetical protein [Niveispirillum irakense]
MRTLGFTERESIQAIIDLMRKQKAKLPVGRIIALDLAEDPVSATLVVEADDGQRAHVHRTAPELAASLVNYCIERRVRLPSSGDKFVEVIAGSLNLVIYLETVAGNNKRSKRPTAHR